MTSDSSTAHLAPRLRGHPPMVTTRAGIDQDVLSNSLTQLPRSARADFQKTVGTGKFDLLKGQFAHVATTSASSWTFAALSLVAVTAAWGTWWRQRAQPLK